MPVAEALAIDRRLQLRTYDPAGDLHALRGLCEWATRFSPLVGLEDDAAPQCLLLDVSGSGPYFGGEPRLLRLVAHGLRYQRWKARIALADTIGAAWAIARFHDHSHTAPPGETEIVLRPLPVEALRLPAESVNRLNALGIVTVGQLMDLPRESIPRRLGREVLDRLDRALGRTAEVLSPYQSLPEIEAAIGFEYATDRRDVLDFALDRLTARVREMLREHDWGARRLECLLWHETVAEPTRLEVGLARPSRSASHFRLLLHTRLERVALSEPVSGITLRATLTARLDDPQAGFLDDEQTGPAALELWALIDQLTSRLGREAVTSPSLVADPQPELACRFDPAIPSADADRELSIRHLPSSASVRVSRPMRLYSEPAPIFDVSAPRDDAPGQFRWLGTLYVIARAWGPERIETGWWRGHDVGRDYYIVETAEGARFWIYYCRNQARWFLHGCFD
jgi:protein ImuB